ncbi:MAG: DUF58 domain-containing protein [Isosphaeraceae bacterium]
MSRDRGYRYLDPAALARVKNLSLVARGVVEGFITGLHSSPYKGFSVEFAEHRKYSPGDNPRHLDWRILGRTDRLYIKQYEEETNLRAQILLDTSASMAYGEPPSITKLQYASYLTAVLSYLMMRQQDAVGMTSFDTEIRLDMPARGSPRHFDEMMNHLEAIKPGRPTNLGATLNRLADRFKRRCLIILISDLYDEPEAVDRAFHHFRHKRHEVIVFHVLDRAEIEFPFRDTSSFLDMETGETIQVDPTYVRDDYRRQIEEFIDRYRRICADCQFDYVLADTSVPLDYMLSRYLEKRTRI